MVPPRGTSDAARNPRSRARQRPSGLLLGVVTAAVIIGAGVGWFVGGADRAAEIALEDPGVVHVHGLGVNPADGALYVATHTGLFRLDGDDAERVADRYQDTMGFTVVGPDRFLASGHPGVSDEDLRAEGKRPLLGLIESTDAGRSWSVRSLLGDADLHTIVVGDDVIVAYDSTGRRVLASSDDGRTWDTRSQKSLLGLAVDPDEPQRLAAITLDGVLETSNDGGRTWTPEGGVPRGVAVVHWSDEGLWAGGSDGVVFRIDLSSGNRTQVEAFEGAVEALLTHGDTVHVAVEGSGIYTSPDRGRSWHQLYRSPAR